VESFRAEGSTAHIVAQPPPDRLRHPWRTLFVTDGSVSRLCNLPPRSSRPTRQCYLATARQYHASSRPACPKQSSQARKHRQRRHNNVSGTDDVISVRLASNQSFMGSNLRTQLLRSFFCVCFRFTPFRCSIWKLDRTVCSCPCTQRTVTDLGVCSIRSMNVALWFAFLFISALRALASPKQDHHGVRRSIQHGIRPSGKERYN
jgi:hypothetical protein